MRFGVRGVRALLLVATFSCPRVSVYGTNDKKLKNLQAGPPNLQSHSTEAERPDTCRNPTSGGPAALAAARAASAATKDPSEGCFGPVEELATDARNLGWPVLRSISCLPILPSWVY